MTMPQTPRLRSAAIASLLLVTVAGAATAAENAGTALTELPGVLRSSSAVPVLKATSWILVEQQSGWILAQGDPDKRIPPASLTKIMTAYLVFKSLSLGDVRPDEGVHISDRAWRQEGSRMFVDVNTEVSVADLLRGVIVQSGNDASVALAEHIAGSEQNFAGRMNNAAAELGMTGSHFTNSTGLPDPDHYTTVRDLSILTRHMIREFPDYYAWHKQKEFTWNEIKQRNRNSLLWADDSVDGVKTGHTREAGYCLIASARRGELRFIGAVVGASSEAARAAAVRALLGYGYANYKMEEVLAAGQPAAQVEVFYSPTREMGLGVDGGARLLVPRGEERSIRLQAVHPEYLEGPLAQGAVAGDLQLLFNDEAVAGHPLVTLAAAAEGGWFGAIGDYLRLLLR